MKLSFYLIMAALVGGFMASCNSDSSKMVIEDYEYNNLIVKSFSLQSNDSIVEGLDSVFFSVDLSRALIFNADSLPKGTRIDRLQVTIGLPTVNQADIVFLTDEGRDSTVNYLTNPNDSIDFSNGPVTLRLKSYSGAAEREYRIQVNVHKMDPDSLLWNQEATCDMPTSLSTVTNGRAIMFEDKVALFTTDGTNVSMAVNPNPYNDTDWIVSSVTLPADADITTLTPLGSSLFVTDGTTLWKSDDAAKTWTATAAAMSHIYGAYGDMILGVRKDADGVYWHTSYPSTNETRVAANCPVSGTSLPITFTSDWAETPMMFFVGGRTASGELSGDMWGYDAGEWACVSRAGVAPGESLVFFPYFSFANTEKGSWHMTKYSTLFTVSNGKTYISRNRGINWQKGDASLQLPAFMPTLTNAQAIVVPETIKATRAAKSSWRELPYLPVTSRSASSRATAPITEWECPYIYVFGGVTTDGQYSAKIWRGVINRLSFKPLQ